MTNPSTKPIRECKGCELNLIDKCAIFHHPILKWKGRNCEGYNNAMYIRHYELTLKPQGAKARKVERASKAKVAKTVPHKDGVKRRAGRTP